MAISQRRAKRKVTGGRYKYLNKKKKKCHLGRSPTMTKLTDKSKTTKIRVLGGNEKTRALTASHINVSDPKNKKNKKIKLKTVLENPANRNYVRRNILTKGTVVDTELGKVKITSRPGQDGLINGILV
ncbi:30S ribosomal protein S8e [Nanoarchaeota archaeon]